MYILENQKWTLVQGKPTLRALCILENQRRALALVALYILENQRWVLALVELYILENQRWALAIIALFILANQRRAPPLCLSTKSKLPKWKCNDDLQPFKISQYRCKKSRFLHVVHLPQLSRGRPPPTPPPTHICTLCQKLIGIFACQTYIQYDENKAAMPYYDCLLTKGIYSMLLFDGAYDYASSR